MKVFISLFLVSFLVFVISADNHEGEKPKDDDSEAPKKVEDTEKMEDNKDKEDKGEDETESGAAGFAASALLVVPALVRAI